MSADALLLQLIADARARFPDRPPLIGVSGAQGSGKSYRCRKFAAAHPRVAHFSLDDVYLSKLKRREMARFTHPLFITRGAPGTHDLDLAQRTIEALRAAAPDAMTPLPRFLKARDDRAPESEWPTFAGRPDAIVFDGWCLGATSPAASAPLNALETADADGVWRAAQAKLLAEEYARFFAAFDAIVYMRAPNWDIVRRWRAEQEAETLGRALTPEDHAHLDRFMQHYESITRHMLAGGHCAGWVMELDEARNVCKTSPASP